MCTRKKVRPSQKENQLLSAFPATCSRPKLCNLFALARKDVNTTESVDARKCAHHSCIDSFLFYTTSQKGIISPNFNSLPRRWNWNQPRSPPHKRSRTYGKFQSIYENQENRDKKIHTWCLQVQLKRKRYIDEFIAISVRKHSRNVAEENINKVRVISSSKHNKIYRTSLLATELIALNDKEMISARRTRGKNARQLTFSSIMALHYEARNKMVSSEAIHSEPRGDLGASWPLLLLR